jgi:hypothetical protein
MSGKGLAYAAIYRTTVTVVAISSRKATSLGSRRSSSVCRWSPRSSSGAEVAEAAAGTCLMEHRTGQAMSDAESPTTLSITEASGARLGDLHVLRNRSVLGIGLGSLLSDTGHEMATAALPGSSPRSARKPPRWERSKASLTRRCRPRRSPMEVIVGFVDEHRELGGRPCRFALAELAGTEGVGALNAS